MDLHFKIMIVCIVFFIMFEFIMYYNMNKRGLTLKKGIFPKINDELIDKFNSYDSELGWVNQPNTTKVDSVGSVKIAYNFDDRGARKSEVTYDEKLISTYGDSFCQCRQVNDDETWQHYLSKKTSSECINFGVGNYGLDQAVLRIEREFDANPTEIVIIAIVPETITRITSVWKHFSEPFRVLNTKPRFKIVDGEIKYIENFIKEKNNFKEMDKYQDFICENDEHYIWLNNRLYTFPFIFKIAKEPQITLAMILSGGGRFLDKIGLKKQSKKLLVKSKGMRGLLRVSYNIKCYEREKTILNYLVARFIKLSHEKKFQPILVTIPQIRDLNYFKQTGENYYSKYFEGFSEVLYVDFMDIFDRESDMSKLFVNGFFGGHISEYGNEIIAETIYEQLVDNKLLNR